MSERYQDSVVTDFYEGKNNLMFLDVGAYDGVSQSNTLKMEREKGWKGICVEPLESAFKVLQKERKSLCVKRAISGKTGEKVEFSQNGLYSGITSKLHRNKIGLKTKKNAPRTKVVTLTLNDLLKQTFAPQFIHYFSLDTQGSAFDILRYVDYKRYTFGMISVEHSFIEPLRTKVIKLLKGLGYVYKGYLGNDDIFIHPSMISGTYIYNNDTTKPIKVEVSFEAQPNNSKLSVITKSDYWPGMEVDGEFNGNKMTYTFNQLGEAKIYSDRLDFGNGIIWKKI